MEDKLYDKYIEKHIAAEEEIELPKSIDIKLNKAYDILRQKPEEIKYKKSGKRKMFAVAASLVLIMFIGLSINPALAESIPVLNQLSNSLKKIYWFNDNYI
ncbi:MAG: hypothetical protein Q8936_22505, partial [Bacillota bacterium]|nr:hypothetical protein [Bacillota bacterium]